MINLKVLIVACFLFLSGIISYASENEKNTNNENNSGSLIIELSNFKSNEGSIRVHLYNEATASYFPNISENAWQVKIEKIENKKARIVFENLPYGKYACTAHHDKNLNEKLDLNILGLPKEAWGLSNNIMPVFSLPNFDDCCFLVNTKETIIFVKMRN